MEQICIFDNCIDEDIINQIEEYLLFNHNKIWIYHPKTVESEIFEQNIKKYDLSENIIKNIDDQPYFVHSIVAGQNITDPTIGPICAKLLMQFRERTNFPFKDIIRLKANLSVPSNSLNNEQHNYVHIDLDEEHYAMIVYLNETDGDTLFFNKKEIIKEVSPKKGRVVIFDGKILHANKTPKKHNNRLVLNIDLTKD